MSHSTKRSTHRKALEKMALHPEILGIKEAVSSVIEKNLFHRRKTLAQPDVIFECKGGDVHIVEYKSNGNGELLRRAQQQIERAVFWYGKYRDVEPDKIHTPIVSGSDPRYKEFFK